MIKQQKKYGVLKVIQGKSMTYILGLRCKDGVVLVSDSIMSRGTETHEEEKIFVQQNGIVIGASGSTGFFDKFLLEINQLFNEGKVKTFQDLLYNVDGCLSKLCQIYGTTDLEVLMAVPPEQGFTSLFHAINTGYSENVKSYLAIGHGAPYGAFLVKNLYRKDMTMKEGAELGVLVIEYFNKFKLDTSVGGAPQIWLIPDRPTPFSQLAPEVQVEYHPHRLSDEEEDEIQKKVKDKLENFSDLFKKMK